MNPGLHESDLDILARFGQNPDFPYLRPFGLHAMHGLIRLEDLDAKSGTGHKANLFGHHFGKAASLQEVHVCQAYA